jgi:ribokinase
LKIVQDQPSGVALILVDEKGENSIAVASGANALLASSDVDAVPDEVFREAKVFLTCLESPLETVARGLERAKQAGLLTIFNPAPASTAVLDASVLRLVDVITPNEGEAAALSHVEIASDAVGVAGSEQSDGPVANALGLRCARPQPPDADAVAAARQLQERGCRKCVVTLGPRGCVVVEEDVTWIEASRVEPVDTTAAGDAFSGALAVALSEGKPLVEAARWASRAAAISVTRAGAQPSLPSPAEIEAFADLS